MNAVCQKLVKVLVLAMVGAGGEVAGQRVEQGEIVHILPSDEGPGLDLRTVHPGFRLFAATDAALSGGRSTGRHGWSFSNYADCTNVLYSCQNQRMVRASNGGTVALWFYNSWLVGSPPVNWNRIRDVAPSADNVLGGGWTAGFNEELTGGFTRWGPADLTLGRLFAGVTSTTDGSCRNNFGFGNAYVPASIPLLAQNICPETWGSEGWTGGTTSSRDHWAAWRAQTGSSAFRFDFWRIPESLRRPGYISPNLHTYGETTDYYLNIRLAYGSVIPGGTGNPALQGYPLGIKVRFDVFSFSTPSVNAVKFVRALVINRSADVWGTGVDYDSLIFGISPGDLGSASTGTAHYYLPDRGAVVRVRAGANTAVDPCNDSFREPVFGCAPTNGWVSGSQTIAFLKTPIGDLRNKLFTRTAQGAVCAPGADLFCDPSHPARGDTFTINQGRMCGFGQCNTYVWVGGGTRSSYGFMAGSESLTLNGRDPNAETASRMWSTFRSPIWPTRARFSKYQPDPTWDYNKDGIPDTLSLTSCHTQGCVGLASDTLPGGFVNLSSNVGTVHAAGPFSLRAGDTTAFFYAVIGEQDSVSTMSQLDAAIDLYMSFFVQPEPPAVAEIVETQTSAATDALGNRPPAVRLVLSDAPQRWTDAYLLKVADDLDAAPPGSPYGDLVALNPGLANTLRARAVDNLAAIEIYKSCDGGQTWTVTDDCRPAPSVDPQQRAIGTGWQAWRTYEVGAPSGLPAAVWDSTVRSGRSYTYAVVTRSRGVTLPIVTVTGGTEMEFAPALRSGLVARPTDPQAVTVYVPASRTAGYRAAQATFLERPTGVTAPFTLDFSDDVTPGIYTATFGTRILVHRDSLAGEPAFQSVVTVEHRVTADVGGSAVPTVLASSTFTRPSGAVVHVAGTGTVAPAVVQPDGSRRVTTTYNGLGFVVAREGVPEFGTVTLGTPDGYVRTAGAVRVSATQPGAFDAPTEVHLRGAASRARLRLEPTDTVTPRDVVNAFMVQWQESRSLSVRTVWGGGEYEVAWADDPWGTTGGFLLNRTNREATAAEVRAALAARATADVGQTDLATQEVTNILQPDLVPVRVPFTVRNLTYDRGVRLAMRRRVSNRIVLGTGQDTISIEVPEDAWIPGDALLFIEDVTSDTSTTVGLVLDNGAPLQITRPRVTFSSAVLGCNTSVRLSCNPLAQGTPGATGYAPMSPGDRTRFHYYTPFRAGTSYRFAVTGPVRAADVGEVTDSALALIRVVPNPYVLFSTYQTDLTNARILFTNLPPSGVLRIYTVAGQLVHQVTWTPDDLQGDGDLFFGLNTMADRPMATGLYIWVITTPENQLQPNGPRRRAAGKFVIIRGAAP